ncbi:hypothetical protein O6P43_027943 [Quillaja saponaria]|uniref:Uncharacterized protein n=1 Tax=Quillaja saponaria TaxID=32244 RepID=A0AAD7L5J3_QUISA|nr:hypothetical protein O6P43_027943 [Quillaja saponaria]
MLGQEENKQLPMICSVLLNEVMELILISLSSAVKFAKERISSSKPLHVLIIMLEYFTLENNKCFWKTGMKPTFKSTILLLHCCLYNAFAISG